MTNIKLFIGICLTINIIMFRKYKKLSSIQISFFFIILPLLSFFLFIHKLDCAEKLDNCCQYISYMNSYYFFYNRVKNHHLNLI